MSLLLQQAHHEIDRLSQEISKIRSEKVTAKSEVKAVADMCETFKVKNECLKHKLEEKIIVEENLFAKTSKLDIENDLLKEKINRLA